jgi:hypothetical protein
MILTLLASILPGVVLPAFKEWLAHKSNVETTKRDIALKTLDARMEAHKHLAATVQAGMSHWPFWAVWSLFAVPLGIWWAAVVLDSVFLFSGAIPDLPDSIKPWADQIFNSIFLSGGGVAGVQLVAKAIGRR